MGLIKLGLLQEIRKKIFRLSAIFLNFGMYQFRGLSPQHLLDCISEELRGVRIHKKNPPLGIKAHDNTVWVFSQGFVAGLTLAQCFFGLSPLHKAADLAGA